MIYLSLKIMKIKLKTFLIIKNGKNNIKISYVRFSLLSQLNLL